MKKCLRLTIFTLAQSLITGKVIEYDDEELPQSDRLFAPFTGIVSTTIHRHGAERRSCVWLLVKIMEINEDLWIPIKSP